MSRIAGGLVLLPLMLLPTACGPRLAAPAVTVQANPTSTEPGEIELFEPKATLAPMNRVRVEVRYRFTKGRPDKYYLWEISFPGTTNHGAAPMDSWQLKPEGVFLDIVQLNKLPVEKFEIRLSEAESPQNGYKIISNVASGKVE
jgi:hypothetical protein